MGETGENRKTRSQCADRARRRRCQLVASAAWQRALRHTTDGAHQSNVAAGRMSSFRKSSPAVISARWRAAGPLQAGFKARRGVLALRLPRRPVRSTDISSRFGSVVCARSIAAASTYPHVEQSRRYSRSGHPASHSAPAQQQRNKSITPPNHSQRSFVFALARYQPQARDGTAACCPGRPPLSSCSHGWRRCSSRTDVYGSRLLRSWGGHRRSRRDGLARLPVSAFRLPEWNLSVVSNRLTANRSLCVLRPYTEDTTGIRANSGVHARHDSSFPVARFAAFAKSKRRSHSTVEVPGAFALRHFEENNASCGQRRRCEPLKCSS